jgi:hypothetical protein
VCVWFQVVPWSGTLGQSGLKVGGKNDGGETVFVQIVLAFAKPSIVKFQVLSLPHSFRYCLHTLFTFS